MFENGFPMLEFISEEKGDLYLTEQKISLLRCNKYCLLKDQVEIGSFFSGRFHSGEKYYSILANDTKYSLKLKSSSLFNVIYQIYSDDDVQAKGLILMNRFNFFNNRKDFVELDNRLIYLYKDHPSSIMYGSNSNYDFELFSGSNKISFSGKFGIVKPGLATFNGTIEIEKNPEMLAIMLGFFWLDAKFRGWIRKNID